MLAPDALLQNRYLIIRPIGKGGMGAVYEARDQRLGNTIALKETFFEDELLRKAFEREARLLAGLRHPALPRVIDHFTEGAGQFLVMEFIPGSDLEEMFKEKGGPFPLNDVMKWADQLLDALDYLHTQETPITHRDMKPQKRKLPARGQLQILRFNIAVNNRRLLRVQIVERIEQLVGPLHHVVQGKRAALLLEHLFQVRAGDKLHDEKLPGPFREVVDHAGQRRVAQA